MVVDAFLYNGEEDLLEIRLNVLDSHVDKFVLVEARETFSGLPKPAYYEENKERFKQWEHKIVHHVVDGCTEQEWLEAKTSPNTGGLDHWCREYIHRENIQKGLLKAGATDDDLTLIGGEYTSNPDLFLTKDYWDTAMAMMRQIEPHMKFIAVTDDPVSAASCLPKDVEITHEVGNDWRMVRYAKYLIIANSSFYILPALLNPERRKVIAPRYWGRRNTGVWSTNQNYYSQFTYI